MSSPRRNGRRPRVLQVLRVRPRFCRVVDIARFIFCRDCSHGRSRRRPVCGREQRADSVKTVSRVERLLVPRLWSDSSSMKAFINLWAQAHFTRTART